MMRYSVTVSRIAGIPIRIHANWFLIAALVTWSLSRGYFPMAYPGWQSYDYWLIGAVTSLLFFGSVLLHELGHALVALDEGVPVVSITLFLLGGVAHIANEPPTPRSEFRIVIAGPLASLILSGFFYLISISGLFGTQISALSLYLTQINLILAIFNLIPGFPLDGGRILRAAIWHIKEDFIRATRLAALTGLVIAFLFFSAGLVFMMRDNLVNGIWISFIGWYLGTAAFDSYRQTTVPEIRGAETFFIQKPVLQEEYVKETLFQLPERKRRLDHE